MPFLIVRNDITKMETDAIVNAANSNLLPGGGVCGAIFAAAGYDALSRECSGIGYCETGDAVITSGYNLKAKYIIHTPGPVYRDGKHGEEKLLFSCYKRSLELAKARHLKSISFPLISSGIYGYPKKEALSVATEAIREFLADNEMDIYLVMFDKNAFEVSSSLFGRVKNYMDERLSAAADFYSDRRRALYNQSADIMSEAACERTFEAPVKNRLAPDFGSMFKKMDKGFSEYLLDLIDRSGMTDAEVYKRANIDRKHFSKIRNNPEYKPKKTTAVAFTIALELDLCETRELLSRAGYALSHSNKFDIIIEYFVQNKRYDIFEINEILFEFDQPLIGG